MKKLSRLFTCLLAVVLLIACVLPVMASEKPKITVVTELVANGTFERVGSTGWASSWWYSGDGIKLTTDGAHNGNYSVHAKANEKEYINQKINGLAGGDKCIFSAWVYVLDGEPSFMTKFEIRDIGNNYLQGTPFVTNLTHQVSGIRRWQKITYEFTMPENADNGYFYIKFKNNTNMYLDDISLIGKANITQTCEILEVPEGNPDVAVNGGLEECDPVTGAPIGWSAFQGWDGGAVSVVKDEERGNNVLRVESDGSTNPWGCNLIPVEALATYQATYLLKTTNLSGSVKFKFEFYADPSNPDAGYSEGQSANFVGTHGTWARVGASIDVPNFAKYVKVYCRLYGGGIVYFDDLTMHKVADAIPIYNSVSAFNYVDIEEGIATARPNTIAYETPEGSRILFEILNGEEVLDSYETEAVPDTQYKFKTALLTNLDTPYTLRITYKHADNSLIYKEDFKIYKVKRPTMLKPDGTFVTKEGKEITPVIGYHLDTLDNLDRCVDMGINVVQWSPSGNVASLKSALDKAYEKGVYIAVLLYDNGHPAGHVSNIEKTRNLVSSCKDHPAVFAWMVQDEAFWNNPHCYPDLVRSYELIHGLDPDHPVYILDSSRFHSVSIGGTCDAYAIDPYVASNELNKVAEITKADSEIGTKLGRPLYAVLQAMDYVAYDPDSNAMRNQAYQVFLAGGASVGYFPLKAELGNPELWNSKRYEGIKYFDNEELEEARKVFVTKEYPTFAQVSNMNHRVWYNIYLKDNELYMILLNMSRFETAEADIPLVSGGVKIGEFTATPVDNSGAETVTGNGYFKATLAPEHMAKYKITVTKPVDFSLMAAPQFNDLTGYDWAKEAIEDLAKIGCVEGKGEGTYEPATPITRGDFAKYLIRTLGLSGGQATDFADVAPDSPYYKEIKVGRALGILNGVGENSFNPEAPISRQDLLTICARALEHINKLDKAESDQTAAFSDNGMIADYAKEAVSAMVWNKIVVGNADGTINPLGNTTRAEAAVIMQRLFNHEIFILAPAGYKA